MTITYKNQDIFQAIDEGQFDVLIHQCNCFNNMGAGIAPLIAKRFPQAELVDKQTIPGDLTKLGSFSHAIIEPDLEMMVINVYGQYHYSRYAKRTGTEYPALRQSLKSVAEFLRSLGQGFPFKIGMPKIGCGLGGGNWEIVSQIIEEELGGYDVTVYCI